MRALLIGIALLGALAAHAQTLTPDDYDKERRDLWFALRTRVLTDDEMGKVAQYGTWLNLENNVPYYPADKAKELNEGYLQQFMIRAAAAAAAKCKTGD